VSEDGDGTVGPAHHDHAFALQLFDGADGDKSKRGRAHGFFLRMREVFDPFLVVGKRASRSREAHGYGVVPLGLATLRRSVGAYDASAKRR